MKTLYIYLICFISAGFSACSLLELEPTTSWSTENTPKEESHLYGILYGGYNTLQSDLSINFLIYGEMRGDAFYNNAFNVIYLKLHGIIITALSNKQMLLLNSPRKCSKQAA